MKFTKEYRKIWNAQHYLKNKERILKKNKEWREKNREKKNARAKQYYLENKEPKPATVEHAEWQAKMNEVSNLAELIIGKQRHGPTGNVFLEFEAMFTKFKDTQIN